MIVKNEAKIIKRCLDSAKPIIDFVSICDTGSNDQTPKIIEKWGQENNIPVTMHYEPFKNFGYNRSLAISLAQETYPESDYLLLLDADMILEVDSKFDKSSLTESQYLTMQYLGQIKFWLTRLLKNSLPWKSVGVTHEYWDIDYERLNPHLHPNYNTIGKLDSLVVNDQEDGGSRTDKFERDKKLLLEGIQDESTPSFLKIRYMFYLAQTYICLDELQDAIIWYKKRVNAGGWAEEVFYSLYQIGICYERLDAICSTKREQIVKEYTENSLMNQSAIDHLLEQEEKSFALAIQYYHNSWEYRPSRAEPLYQLAKMHRLKGNNNIGLMYAIKGREIPYPKDDILFIDYHVYDYLFDYEISICAYYIENKRYLGRDAQGRLQKKIKELPTIIAEIVTSNSKFYSK
jgi:glycosyltransferase involved in cell wall biosynthesis